MHVVVTCQLLALILFAPRVLHFSAFFKVEVINVRYENTAVLLLLSFVLQFMASASLQL